MNIQLLQKLIFKLIGGVIYCITLRNYLNVIYRFDGLFILSWHFYIVKKNIYTYWIIIVWVNLPGRLFIVQSTLIYDASTNAWCVTAKLSRLNLLLIVLLVSFQRVDDWTLESELIFRVITIYWSWIIIYVSLWGLIGIT